MQTAAELEQSSFAGVIPPPPPPKGGSIQEKFEKFSKTHPEVYTMLVRFARELKANGRGRCGISLLWERLRWYYYIERRDSKERYKLSNNYRSRYSRLIEDQEPDLVGLFQMRKTRTP